LSKELEIKMSNFESETSNGVTLVDFWAPWCAPCRMQDPIIEKIAYTFTGKAKVGKCNTDEEQALAVKFGIKSIPTMILFQNGKEADRFIGVQTEHVLSEIIKNLIVKSG
jgi:thioredoxin 1